MLLVIGSNGSLALGDTTASSNRHGIRQMNEKMIRIALSFAILIRTKRVSLANLAIRTCEKMQIDYKPEVAC